MRFRFPISADTLATTILESMKGLGFRGRIAVRAGRIAAGSSRALGRGSGGMIGGAVAAKLCPDILARLAAGKRCVIVTGTNGKSTTTRMITFALQAAGHTVATNRGGDNMEGGLITAFMENLLADFAVLEVDEMHVPTIAKMVQPQVITYLNLSRDQLDRVGEMAKIEGRLRTAVSENPQATIVANCDDPLITSAAYDAEKAVWVAAGAGWTGDALSCPRVGGPILRQGVHWYAQSGGFSRPRPDWFLAQVGKPDALTGQIPLVGELCGAETPADSTGVEKLSAQVIGENYPKSGGQYLPDTAPDPLAGRTWVPGDPVYVANGFNGWTMRLSLPGRANRGNGAQALASAVALGVKAPTAITGIEKVSEVAGRYGVARFDERRVRLILAKNPAGWQESLTMLDPLAIATVVAVNGQVGDGIDLSWLWDVDFAQLREPVIACGERGRDLQVRLAYAGVDCQYAASPFAALNMCPQGRVDLLANYTAFRDIRIELINRGIWQ